jgi:uncharacterized protein YcfJ
MYSFKQFLIETKEHIERLKQELSGRGISDEEINRLILDNPEDSIAGFYETGKSLFPNDAEADKALGDMILSRDQAAREKASKEEIARAEKATTQAEKEESSKRGREQRASFEEQQKAAKARAEADRAEAARAETGRRMAAETQPSTTAPKQPTPKQPTPKQPTPQIEEPGKSVFYDFGKGVKDETVNVLGDLKGSIPGMRKPPVSSLGKGAPFGGGIDLGIRMGMDYYDMYQDPQWQFKPSEWSDVVKSELKNIGYSALAGTVIGGLIGGPVGAGMGAVAGGLEAIATAPYGVASNVMKSGYEERGTVKDLETRLKTTEQLLKNASDPETAKDPEIAKMIPAYKAAIEKNKKAIEDAKSNESMLSKFSKGVDAVVGLDIGLGRKGIPKPEPKTPTELRAAAEERFAERYPTGIPGGLAPGKSASQVERETAEKITKEMGTGSTPEQLAKRYGFETEQEENERIASGGKTKAEVEFEKKLAVATERLKAERAERDRKAMERFEKSRYSL